MRILVVNSNTTASMTAKIATPAGSGTRVISMDENVNKMRHLIDCFFSRVQRFRRAALRCEKTLSSFGAFVATACTMI